MLPPGDKTPSSWILPANSPLEQLKTKIRLFSYPSYLQLINATLKRRFDPQNRFKVDQWYWGCRGLEYELLRARVDKTISLRGKDVLIAGCGTGRDIPSWLRYNPNKLMGVDYFSYARAWESIKCKYASTTPLEFLQADLVDLCQLPDSSVDVIGSDAVFEHVQDLPRVLQEFSRILKKDGIVYATFGPLWYTWGGDHISGTDNADNGYNHILLPAKRYKNYLASFGQQMHSEHDGRTWLDNNLFSYLRPHEYLEMMVAAGFSKLHLGMVIEPRAVRYLKRNPGIRDYNVNLEDLDLLVTGMSLIYRKIYI